MIAMILSTIDQESETIFGGLKMISFSKVEVKTIFRKFITFLSFFSGILHNERCERSKITIQFSIFPGRNMCFLTDSISPKRAFNIVSNDSVFEWNKMPFNITIGLKQESLPKV